MYISKDSTRGAYQSLDMYKWEKIKNKLFKAYNK